MDTFVCKRCGAECRDGVQCSACQGRFDFPCSGITEAGYRKLGDRKNTWKCPTCKGNASPLFPPTKPTSSADIESIAQDIKRLSAQMSSLPTLITSINAIQADIADLKSLKSDIAELKLMKTDIEDMKTSVDFVHNSVETLSTRLSDIAQEVQGLLQTKEDVQQLHKRLEILQSNMKEADQRARMNNIEIKGVPLSKDENLFDLVSKLGNRISCPVTKDQINYVARVPMRNDKENKNIVVSVHNRYLKEQFVAASKKCTIISANLGLRGDKRIYINDHLTQENKKLLNDAKTLAKEKGYAFIWVKGCKIFVRKSATSSLIQIRSESDLTKIMQ